MSRTAAQIDGGAVRVERELDPSLLKMDVRDRRQVERSLDRQQVAAGDFVVCDEALQGAVVVAGGAEQVGQPLTV